MIMIFQTATKFCTFFDLSFTKRYKQINKKNKENKLNNLIKERRYTPILIIFKKNPKFKEVNFDAKSLVQKIWCKKLNKRK